MVLPTEKEVVDIQTTYSGAQEFGGGGSHTQKYKVNIQMFWAKHNLFHPIQGNQGNLPGLGDLCRTRKKLA